MFALSTGYPQDASYPHDIHIHFDNELWTTHFAVWISSYPQWSGGYPHGSEACGEALGSI